MKDFDKQASLQSFAQLPKENFDAEYLRLIKLDIAEAQSHLDDLPERDRRGLTLETLRHFACGYLPNWILTKSRAEFTCGLYVKNLTGEPKHLPPPSERIIIPTPSMQHFNAVATSSARLKMSKDFWKQHAGTMELFRRNRRYVYLAMFRRANFPRCYSRLRQLEENFTA